MIIEEVFREDEHGKLIRRYSSKGMKLCQIDTGAEYDEAIDIENTTHAYEETNIPIDAEIDDEGYLDAQNALNIVFGEGGEDNNGEINS